LSPLPLGEGWGEGDTLALSALLYPAVPFIPKNGSSGIWALWVLWGKNKDFQSKSGYFGKNGESVGDKIGTVGVIVPTT